jgi:hypothetical protein
MILDTLRPCGLAALLVLAASTVKAETLIVNVMDERNRGVHSRVLYKITAPPSSVLGDTDNQGKLVRDHSCVAGQVFTARPFDIGSYFESPEEACKSQVTLRVISRQTPRGPAVQFHVETIKLTDGSPGVIVYKGVVTTNASDTAMGVASCSVEVNPVVEQRAFKTGSGSWEALAGNEVNPSAILSGSGWPQSKSVLLPFDCGTSRSRIQVLRTDAATELSRRLTSSGISVQNSLRTLGLQ